MVNVINIELNEVATVVELLMGKTVLIDVAENYTLALKMKKEALPEDADDAAEIIEGLWDS